MRAPWEVIQALESTNSRLEKEAIIAKELAEDNQELFAGFALALDPLITFGVKKVPEKPSNNETERGLSYAAFLQLAESLRSRNKTGNDAAAAINFARMNSTAEQWNRWYRRILTKDLRCGVSEKTVNKVIKDQPDAGYQPVPVFSCQLAHDGAKHEKRIAGTKLVEVKLDGVRVITVVYPDKTVIQYSRNGRELVNFEHIKQQIAKHAVFFSEPVVLDGEVMSANFQDLMKQVHRKTDVAAEDAVLHLFDIITLREFQAGVCQHRQLDRSVTLDHWYNQFQDHMPNVTVVGRELVDLETDSGQAQFKAINEQAVAGGYEGIMIKDPEAPYETKRSHSWLKIKPFIEVSLRIIAVEEGEAGKRNQGKLGALVVEGEDGGRLIRTNVGAGYSDEQREEFWKNRDSLVGQIVEVRADAATRAQDSEVWSLRFPRFLRFRGFAAGEKI